LPRPTTKRSFNTDESRLRRPKPSSKANPAYHPRIPSGPRDGLLRHEQLIRPQNYPQLLAYGHAIIYARAVVLGTSKVTAFFREPRLSELNHTRSLGSPDHCATAPDPARCSRAPAPTGPISPQNRFRGHPITRVAQRQGRPDYLIPIPSQPRV